LATRSTEPRVVQPHVPKDYAHIRDCAAWAGSRSSIITARCWRDGLRTRPPRSLTRSQADRASIDPEEGKPRPSVRSRRMLPDSLLAPGSWGSYRDVTGSSTRFAITTAKELEDLEPPPSVRTGFLVSARLSTGIMFPHSTGVTNLSVTLVAVRRRGHRVSRESCWVVERA
jgi:hypothetical protein